MIDIRPHISEKSYDNASNDIYTFDVPINASKPQIASAVSKYYDVTALDVRVSVSKGKSKRSYRKRMRPLTGHRVDEKKAYVRLKQGDKIPVFEENT